MGVSTLFAAFVFRGLGLEKTVRWFMIANGLIVPFIALQTFYHPLIWVASLWAVTLPGSTISLAVLFRKKLREFHEASEAVAKAGTEAIA